MKEKEQIRLLVVDDNENLVEMIKDYFEDHKKIKVVNGVYNGEEALKIIEKEPNSFDVMLLDLIMPKKDGMYVLKEMRSRGIDKKVIVATSYNAGEVIREVAEYGVNYLILKPFDLEDLEKRIIEVCSKKKESKTIDFETHNLQVSITKMLHELGIPSHIKGYQFLRDAINIVFDRPDVIGGITKELYPELAGKYDTTVSRVERAIRHAIEVSWNRGSWDMMEELFGHSVDIDKAKPTNSEFIVTLADKLRMDFHRIAV